MANTRSMKELSRARNSTASLTGERGAEDYYQAGAQGLVVATMVVRRGTVLLGGNVCNGTEGKSEMV